MEILTQFGWKFEQMAPKICRTQSQSKASYEIEELIIKFHQTSKKISHWVMK